MSVVSPLRTRPSPAPPRLYQPSGKTTSQPGDYLHAEQGSNVRCIPALAPRRPSQAENHFPAGGLFACGAREQCPLYPSTGPAPPQPSGKPLPSRETVWVGCMGSNVRCIPAPAPRPHRTRPNQPVDCLRRVHGGKCRCIPAPAPRPHRTRPNQPVDCLRRVHGGKCRCIPAPAPRPRRTRPNQHGDCLRRVHGGKCRCIPAPAPHPRRTRPNQPVDCLRREHGGANAVVSPPQPRTRAALGQISRWTVCVGCMRANAVVSPPQPPRPHRTRPNQPVDCLHREHREHREQCPLYLRSAPAPAQPRAAPAIPAKRKTTSQPVDCLRRVHGEQCPLYPSTGPAPAPHHPGPTRHGGKTTSQPGDCLRRE